MILLTRAQRGKLNFKIESANHAQTADRATTDESGLGQEPPFPATEANVWVLRSGHSARSGAIDDRSERKGEAVLGVAPKNLIAARPGVLAALASARPLPGRYRSNDSLEIRVRSGPAMDRHMQGDIQSQPLDGV